MENRRNEIGDKIQHQKCLPSPELSQYNPFGIVIDRRRKYCCIVRHGQGGIFVLLTSTVVKLHNGDSCCGVIFNISLDDMFSCQRSVLIDEIG